MELKKKIIISGQTEALSGLLIGGSSNSMAIGGPDKIVIRNPINNKPYIPGSSLKGKMRSLLEISYGYIKDVSMGQVKNGPDDDYKKITCILFGSARGDEHQRPSRIIVRDGELQQEMADFKNTDLPYTEAKTEVVIDRITSKAMPRTFERVPAGAMFDLNIVLNVFDGDNEKELLSHVFKGLQMIQDDYLGGAGSRGSGRVKFHVGRVNERTAGYYHGKEQEKDVTGSCGLPDDLK